MSRGVAPAVQDEAFARRVAADEIRVGTRRMQISLITLVVTLIFIGISFQPTAVPLFFKLWAVAQSIVVMALIVATTAFSRIAPDDDRVLGFWVPLGSKLLLLLNLTFAGSMWALLPGAPTELVHLMILLYCWCIFVQVAGDTGAGAHTGAAMIIVLASLTAYVIVSGQPYRFAMAGFFVLFGATVLGLRRIVRAAVLDALVSRTSAQQSEAALKVALAQVAAERAAKSRFLAAASHDLQQPIQAAHLYFGQLARVDQPRLRSEIETAGKAAFGAAQSLLSAMLDHLRLGAQAVTPRLEEVALGGLFAQVAAEATLAAESSAVTRWKTTVATVRADRALLARTLGNLVQNAVRHSGGSRILIVARQQRGTVQIYVIDDGRGIPVDQAEAIFEEFGQGTAGTMIGFGIGLASARVAMRVQGGDVALDRRWRGGAAFTIVFASVATANEEILCVAA